MESQYVALMRGINVGGKNKLPMSELRTIFEELGCASVRTYIQSGNVVFAADARLAKVVAAQVANRIADVFSISVPVILRSAAEYKKAVRSHPLATPDMPDNTVSVMFLADKPTMTQVKSLDPNRSPGDSFKVVGKEIYMLSPNGAARSKLTNAYFDRSLNTISTTRNWRTCRKLLEMVS